MAAGRLSMRQIKEVLRQKWVLERTHREVAESAGVSVGVVGKLMQKSAAAKLDWTQVEGLSEQQLEERLYGVRVAAGTARPLPDPAYIHAERRRPGVTLELLHLEYLEQHPEGYHYSQFCEMYRRWLKKQRSRGTTRWGDRTGTDAT